ncbi:MAG: hypothetical protein M1839_008550 [Geoglossum umbratile]|nr:MAG: hypothetical protein M1839_008550 [Geoglossum umbratile]
MANPPKSEIIQRNPIGDGLKNLVIDLILALQHLPAARLLPSPNGRGVLRDDLLRFLSPAVSSDFNISSVISLLNKVIDTASDADIWSAVCSLVTESTPPPRQRPYPDRTPISFNTGSFANTSEYRKQFNGALKDELDSSLYIDIPGFFDAFFGEVTNLESVTEAVFRKCQEGENPLYKEGKGGGWRDWPKDAVEDEVLEWFKKLIDMLLEFARENHAVPNIQRRPLGQPSQHLLGSTLKRKLDIGFSNGTKTNESLPYDWLQILVPGELKSNLSTDRRTDTWLDLTLVDMFLVLPSGSIMRLWEFDRLGGIASSAFDINKEGLQFVSVVLGYLLMNEEQLGFDPTITESDGKRYMEITRNGKRERLVLVELMKRHSSVAGRATTCWKAYRDRDESMTTLVIKDSWQYPEREEEEGELLRDATEKKVANVARYYHHKTVCIGGKEDDINDNIRKGLHVMKATNAFRRTPASSKAEGTAQSRSASGAPVGGASRSRSTARKRSSSSLNAPLPPNKRSCSTSPHKDGERSVLPNRIHRRVILRDYGKNIYMASSRVAMLAALEGNIEGHESLRNLTSIIQSDVSKGNLMMNEDGGNSSWSSFLIDLDLAIKEDRVKSSGAPKKTGTRAFMAIGALYGENHSFMHDLESFFWVLFWICIHYNGPNKKSRVIPKFEKWNYEDMDELAKLKQGTVADESYFIKEIREHFTPYYQSLVPWINRLRRVVFPNDKPWKREDKELYSQMKAVLEKARNITSQGFFWRAEPTRLGRRRWRKSAAAEPETNETWWAPPPCGGRSAVAKSESNDTRWPPPLYERLTIAGSETNETWWTLLNDYLKGEKYHVLRQHRDTEIQKNYVFISEENASGIKKWHDGFPWGEVESSEDFETHVNDGGLHRNMWTFKVDGLKHQVISYY